MMATNEVNIRTSDFSEIRGTEPAAERHKLTIALYSIVVALYWMAQYIYAATLPSYVQSKTTSLTNVGFILSMYGLCQAFVRLPVGICTDWIGWRKPFVIVGLTLTGIGALVLGTGDSANGLILGRAITGIAAGAWVPLVVAFSSLFPPKDSIRAAGFLILLQATGRIVASAANGPLNLFGGYRLAFYTAAGIAALSVLFAGMIREPRRVSTTPSIRVIGHLMTRRDVMLPSALAGLSQAVTWGVSLSFIPIAAKQAGGTANTQGVLATLAVVMLAVGSFSVNSMTKSFGPKRVVILCFALMFIGSMLAALAGSVPVLFTSQTFLGLGLGFGYPSLMGLSIRTVVDSERTIAMGIHQTVYAFGMFIGPAACGAIAQTLGIHQMFLITAALSLMLGYWGAQSLTSD
jgi:MFS family permease